MSKDLFKRETKKKKKGEINLALSNKPVFTPPGVVDKKKPE